MQPNTISNNPTYRSFTENDDGTVQTSVQVTLNKRLSPAFLAAVFVGIEGAIKDGLVPGVTFIKGYRGADTGVRSSIKVSYEFDNPDANGYYGAIVKVTRPRIVAAMSAIVGGSHQMASYDLVDNIRDALAGDDAISLLDVDYANIASVALFDRLATAATADA